MVTVPARYKFHPNHWRSCGTAIVVAFILAARLAEASADLCEQAARIASADTGVPLEVLRAIMLTESGRTLDGALQPWPWAVNEQGRGHWLTTRKAAQELVENRLSEGVRSIDIGCFQLNYRWHAAGFADLSDMFDPVRNASYAARFLSGLHTESGDWTSAAGAYHSRTLSHASRYRTRFAAVLESTRGQGPTAARAEPPRATVPREPAPHTLFRAGAPQSAGSLMPQGATPRGTLFGNLRHPLIGS